MILVFGGTGTIGGAALQELAARGVPVRAAARTPERAEELVALPGETVVADLADPASLETAVRGVDSVFLVTPASAEQVRLESNLVDVLARTAPGVHLVKVAALGYDAVPVEQAMRYGANHARVVAHIREQGVPHTVLAPSGFMSNLLASAGTIRQGALYGSSGDGGVSWIDPRDVAAVAAAVLTGPVGTGASHSLTGPEVLTHDQLADTLSDVLSREVRYVDVPPEQFPAVLRQAGVDEWTAEALTELHQLYRAHASEVVTHDVEALTGRPPRSLADWLADHRGAFAG